MLRNGSNDETSSAETSIPKAAFAACASDGEKGTEFGAPDHPRRVCSGPDHPADARMASLIEDEMIPKLIAAFRTGIARRKPSSGLQPATGGICLAPDLIADTALDSEPGVLMDMVEEALACGLSHDSLLVDVLAPAARCLGSRWENDTVDFIEVTMGLWRMQEVVHELSARRAADFSRTVTGQPEIAGKRILFAVAPGDTHSFGSVILEEMFEQAGWATRSCRDGNLSKLRAAARSQWFEMIALTVSIDQPAADIAGLVMALRQSSRNPDVRIMVGGEAFTDRPGLADDVGADATAEDGRAAIQMAALLLENVEVEHLASRANGQTSGLRSPRAQAFGGLVRG